MGVFVEGPFRCKQVPAATIQGQVAILWMSSFPMPGQGHSRTGMACQVRVLELAGVRREQDLEGLEVTFGPDLALPDSLLGPAAGHDEVLRGVGRNRFAQGLESKEGATCNAKASYSRLFNK